MAFQGRLISSYRGNILKFLKKKYLTLAGILAFSCFLVLVIVSALSADFTMNSKNNFFLPAIHQHFTNYQWTETGIPNISEAAFELDPNQPEKFYAGTIGNGLWYSEDKGQNWEFMGNGFPVTVTVSHLAVAPISPTVIYAGIRGGINKQFYRSLDGGDSWQGLMRLSYYSILSLAVNPVTPTTVYAGVGAFKSPSYGGEVYRSTNGGSDWTQILPHHTLASYIVVDPTNPSIVYVGRLIEIGGMLKSSDGGDSWNAINNGLPPDALAIFQILLHPDDPQTIFIATSGGLFRSFDAGESWVSIGADLPVPRVSSIAFVPGTPEIFFATPVEGDNYYGIYQSLDSGNTWQRFAPNPVNEEPLAIQIQVQQTTDLYALYDGYWEIDGRFWRLGSITP